jgi:hypothetical protein
MPDPLRWLDHTLDGHRLDVYVDGPDVVIAHPR